MTHARIARKIPPAFSLDLDLQLTGITALFGPPQSGKSLALEIIAGFRAPDSGRILLDDAILFDGASGVNVQPRRRGIGWIGPEAALFPHLTLEQNLKFAARRFPRLERHRRVAEMLERFQLSPFAKTRPPGFTAVDNLRGAVARALISEPKLVLIDDCGLKEPLLREIRAVTDAPILLVTRDLDLCCALAGSLVLLDHGRILHRGAPLDVVRHPDSLEAARVLGIHNLLQGTIAALDPARNSSRIDLERFSLNGPYIKGHFRGDQIWVAVDPHHLRVHPGDAGVANSVAVQLLRTSPGVHTVRLEFAGPVIAEISNESYACQRDNKSWQLEFPPDALVIL